MPERGDFSIYLHGVDTQILQRSSINQGWASRCCCGNGVKSEIYDRCVACFELIHDVKAANQKKPSELLLDVPWKSTEIPTPAVVYVKAPDVDIGVAIPFGSPPAKRVTRARSSPSNDNHLANARASPCRSSTTSPYLHLHPQRGRPPNGSRVGRIGFKGVRQRKNVRGYLVEIRPPKWKKTIWLGTYNSDREAAGAYDAGIFYTNKKTKYNFPMLEGTFPPLPSQLRLGNADDSEEIKTFVQREAREAARKVKSLNANSDDQKNHPNVPFNNATASSSDESAASDQEHVSLLDIPEEDWSPCWDVIWWPSMVPFDCMKQEENSLAAGLDTDAGNSSFMCHSLV